MIFDPRIAALVGLSALLAGPAFSAAPFTPPAAAPAPPVLHVTVDNAAANPVATRLSNPADIAKALVDSTFQTNISVPASPGARCYGTYQVPPGKRFMVTYLTYYTRSGAPDTFMTFGSVYIASQPFRLYFPAPQPTPGAAIPDYVGAQPIAFFANPGDIISIGVGYSTDRGSPTCTFSLSGQLVDYP